MFILCSDEKKSKFIIDIFQYFLELSTPIEGKESKEAKKKSKKEKKKEKKIKKIIK